MAKLLNKLNVLVRSNLPDVRGGEGSTRRSRARRPLTGKGLDREIAALRAHIEDALAAEDKLTASLAALEREIAGWDRQADEALSKGDEATARYAVQQMQLAQRRAAMLEADREHHRRATAELISRVNELEALVVEARQSEAQAQAPAAGDDDDSESLADRLRRVREQIATQDVPAVTQASEPEEVDEQAIEDDLARRRARLSQ